MIGTAVWNKGTHAVSLIKVRMHMRVAYIIAAGQQILIVTGPLAHPEETRRMEWHVEHNDLRGCLEVTARMQPCRHAAVSNGIDTAYPR